MKFKIGMYAYNNLCVQSEKMEIKFTVFFIHWLSKIRPNERMGKVRPKVYTEHIPKPFVIELLISCRCILMNINLIRFKIICLNYSKIRFPFRIYISALSITA